MSECRLFEEIEGIAGEFGVVYLHCLDLCTQARSIVHRLFAVLIEFEIVKVNQMSMHRQLSPFGLCEPCQC
jgi:hypothetical protein